MTPKPRTSARLSFDALEDRAVPVAGFFEPTFGTNGISLVPFLRRDVFTNAVANAVAVQRDGKIVVAGSADSPLATGDLDMAVARLNRDGTLDPTFGAGGRLLIPFDLGGNNRDFASAVAIQADGKIVVAGTVSTQTNGTDFAFARLNANGTLDGSFQGGGKFNFNFGLLGTSPVGDTLGDMVLQPDGKIVAVGNSAFSGFGAARFNPNGTVDTTFDGDGKQNVSVSGSTIFQSANAVALQADGKIVVAGTVNSGLSSNDIAAIRLNPNGAFDTTFAGNGKFVGGFAASGGGSANDVTVVADGGIVIAGAGKTTTSNGTDFAVVKLSPNGAYDPSFSGGKKIIPLDIGTNSKDDRANAVVVQQDGKIVVAGTAARDVFGDGEFAMARLFADGQLDTTFGNNGTNRFSVGFQGTFFGDILGNDLAFQTDGSFIVVGSSATEMAVIQVQGDGGGGGGPPGGGGGLGFGNSVLAMSAEGGQIAAVGVTFPGEYDTDRVVRVDPRVAFPGFNGVVRTAVGDVNGDSIPDFAVVTGPGTPTQFAVISGDLSAFVIPPSFPFRGSESFDGGGLVSVGDLTGDGLADVVITADQGGGPRVTIFQLVNGVPTIRANFFGIDDPNFRGGARTAVGDVNGDGVPDLAVAAGAGGGPRVALYDGSSVLSASRRKLVGDFFAFENVLRNGVFLTIGDVDVDGSGDLIFGAGAGGAPRVLTISGKSLVESGTAAAFRAPLSNFFVAGNTSDRGGVRVAVKNIDGDGIADLVTGSGEGQPSRTRVYRGAFFGGPEPGVFQDIDPFGGQTFADGVFVG